MKVSTFFIIFLMISSNLWGQAQENKIKELTIRLKGTFEVTSRGAERYSLSHYVDGEVKVGKLSETFHKKVIFPVKRLFGSTANLEVPTRLRSLYRTEFRVRADLGDTITVYENEEFTLRPSKRENQFGTILYNIDRESLLRDISLHHYGLKNDNTLNCEQIEEVIEATEFFSLVDCY